MAEETIINDDDVIVDVEGEETAATEPDPAEELRAQFREKEAEAQRERSAREQAQREAAQHRQEAESARAEAQTYRNASFESDYGNVLAGIEAAKASGEAAKRDIRAARDAGDYDKEMEAQERLADARAQKIRLDEAKADLDVRKTRREHEPERREQPQQTQTQSDPVEAFISLRTAPTQKWLREHRDYLTDSTKNHKLTAAHYSALGDGLAPDTEQYFEHVETTLGLREGKPKPNGKGEERQRSGNGQFRRGSAPPVAPVAQSGGGTSGGGTEVRLSAKEATAATDGTLTWNYDDPSGKKKFKKGDPIGVAEYARRKLAMQRDGRYDKSFTEN